MAGYKEPGFQERVAVAAQARQTALAKLKSKPQLDEAEVARLKAEHDAREAAKLANAFGSVMFATALWNDESAPLAVP